MKNTNEETAINIIEKSWEKGIKFEEKIKLIKIIKKTDKINFYLPRYNRENSNYQIEQIKAKKEIIKKKRSEEITQKNNKKSKSWFNLFQFCTNCATNSTLPIVGAIMGANIMIIETYDSPFAVSF